MRSLRIVWAQQKHTLPKLCGFMTLARIANARAYWFLSAFGNYIVLGILFVRESSSLSATGPQMIASWGSTNKHRLFFSGKGHRKANLCKTKLPSI